jgi:hypothetical protein
LVDRRRIVRDQLRQTIGHLLGLVPSPAREIQVERGVVNRRREGVQLQGDLHLALPIILAAAVRQQPPQLLVSLRAVGLVRQRLAETLFGTGPVEVGPPLDHGQRRLRGGRGTVQRQRGRQRGPRLLDERVALHRRRVARQVMQRLAERGVRRRERRRRLRHRPEVIGRQMHVRGKFSARRFQK